MNTSFMSNPGNPMIPPTDENRDIFQPFPFESKYRPATSVFQTHSSEFKTVQRPSAFLTHPNLKSILPYTDNTELNFLNSGPSSANSFNKENINENYSSRSILGLSKQESKDTTEEQRAAIKKARNRTAARRSREKKLRFVMSLEQENRQLWIQNSSLITELNGLKDLLLEKRMDK
ncbi:hypothetical protein CONCODRAFT_73594 [Conidiobolus coronatus NRRL 28638]|uniref:BZIP domain-containing protein n=1 Tax=Conidiobolus coronatus (strain ATCC 28846 / CBS 209.66 / NRRL 28638) TaxID=796925 RepID=A0A137NUU0_CONC2|nr:hypothetical protein CONCODRAFT_73594 [Conidiobolus coronatus NRRL 28638]|eukprot:KXN66573.1 hypothetical protein CONCODRAFT_73594 [Conidiobolus coronatus NRRL 28638]